MSHNKFSDDQLLNALAMDFNRNVLNKKNFHVLDDDLNQLKIIDHYIQNGKYLFSVNLNSYCQTSQFINSTNLDMADLLIIDINLEDQNGYKVAQRIRRTTPFEIPIIFISSNRGLIKDFYKYDIRNSYFLPKPFNQGSLEDAVSSFFGDIKKDAS